MSKKEYYKLLADDVMLEFSIQELDEISKNDAELKKLFARVLAIDTANVDPLFYPYDTVHTFLREDDVFEVMDKQAILANAPAADADFVTIVKVVK